MGACVVYTNEQTNETLAADHEDKKSLSFDDAGNDAVGRHNGAQKQWSHSSKNSTTSNTTATTAAAAAAATSSNLWGLV